MFLKLPSNFYYIWLLYVSKRGAEDVIQTIPRHLKLEDYCEQDIQDNEALASMDIFCRVSLSHNAYTQKQ